MVIANNPLRKQVTWRSWIKFTPKQKSWEREWGKDKSQTLLTWRSTAFLSTPLLGFPKILSNRAKLKLPMIPTTPIITLRPQPNRSQSRRLRRSRSLRRSPVTTFCSPVAVEQVAAVFLMLWWLRTSILSLILSLANRYEYSFCFSLDYAILMNFNFVAKISKLEELDLVWIGIFFVWCNVDYCFVFSLECEESALVAWFWYSATFCRSRFVRSRFINFLLFV